MSPRLRERKPDLDFDELVQKDPAELNDDEARFLQDRNARPQELEPVPVVFYLPDGTPISNDQSFFSQQSQNTQLSEEQLNAIVEERARAIAADLVKQEMVQANRAGGENHGNALNAPAKGGTKPPGVDNSAASDGDGEGEGDYSTWHARDLETELSRRGLNIHGRKAELVARLERDDEGELQEGDEVKK